MRTSDRSPHRGWRSRGINGRFSKLFPGLFLIEIEIVIECTVESKAQGCDVYLNDTGFACGCLVSPGGTQ